MIRRRIRNINSIACQIKCGGAPQKVMYLAESHFRKSGVRAHARVKFVTAGTTIFGVPKYKPVLEKIVESRGIETHFRHNLIEIRADAREAVFKQMDTGDTIVMPYDMIHVTPPTGEGTAKHVLVEEVCAAGHVLARHVERTCVMEHGRTISKNLP